LIFAEESRVIFLQWHVEKIKLRKNDDKGTQKRMLWSSFRLKYFLIQATGL